MDVTVKEDKTNLNKLQKNSAESFENDELIKHYNSVKELTKVERFKNASKKYKFTIPVILIVIVANLVFSDEAKDIWKWIKLHAQEAIATGPTLSNDPIGVFSRSFVNYTNGIAPIDKESLIPLNFHSITRYKLDAVRFKSEFSIQSNGSNWAKCLLIVEGALSKADGGVDKGSYVTYTQCQNSNKNIVLDGYTLVAFPPETNKMLAPPEYYLYKN